MLQIRPMIVVLGAIGMLMVPGAWAQTVQYDLTIAEQTVSITGKPAEAMTVNGGIPGPTLRFTEGDLAHIRVHNRMRVETSVHWHGLLVPPGMDGVPNLSFPPIKAGATFTYEFPIRQSGTYWYHSHTGLQEQRGVYGAIVIAQADAAPETDGEAVIVLSDWTDEHPDAVLRTLKRGSDWYAVEKGSAQSIIGAARIGMTGDYFMRELQRMPPMDIADVAYDRFLANGAPEIVLAARPLQTVRLRIINGSATTYFHIEFADGPLTIIAADGQDVAPVVVQRLLIGVAETYDVIVKVPGPGAWELRATAHDGSGYSSVWIGDGKRYPAPNIPKPNLYKAMGHGGLKQLFAFSPAAVMGMPDARVEAGHFDSPGMMPMEGMGHGDMGGNDTDAPGKMPMEGMDHGDMGGHGTDAPGEMPMEGMGHGDMGGNDTDAPGKMSMEGMDHGDMGGHGTDAPGEMPVEGMDHGDMGGNDTDAPGKMSMEGMDHGDMGGHGTDAPEEMPMEGMDHGDIGNNRVDSRTDTKAHMSNDSEAAHGHNTKDTSDDSMGHGTQSMPVMDSGMPPRDGRRFGHRFGLLAADVSAAADLAVDGVDPRRPGTPYEKLRSTRPTAFGGDRPVREIRFTLDGDMERYVWLLNNRPISESDVIRIREGEIVQFIMINRTMMHHPMHLHGHFFRVLNGQGDFAPLKHTVDVAPMSTTVIEFNANEVGDWFFHCHLLYHMKSGMARVVGYEGFTPGHEVAALQPKMFEDPWYFLGRADVLSNMTEGRLSVSNTRNIVAAEWEAGWQIVDDPEWEGLLTWDRYANRFISVFAGVDVLGVKDDVENTRGVLGFRYLLPLNVGLRAWADSEGGARFMLEKHFDLTPRIQPFAEVEYDTHTYWEGQAGVSYLLSKRWSIEARWHSEYGFGGGVQVRF